jgi:hypothetical protein
MRASGQLNHSVLEVVKRAAEMRRNLREGSLRIAAGAA